jgi:NHL repeat
MRWIASPARFVFYGILSIAYLTSCKPSQSPVPDESSSASSRTLVVERIVESSSIEGGLRKPCGLAVGIADRLYLADTDNNRVILLDKDFRMTHQQGGFGGGDARLSKPSWLAIDNDLAVVVSDFGNRRLCRFDSDLHFINEILFYSYDEPLKFSYPTGIFVARHGEVWVGDKDNGRIAVFSVNGQFDRFVGTSSGAGLLRNSEKMILDNQQMLVCDAGNYRVAVYDLFGGFVRDFGDSELSRPTGLCRMGGLYAVVDQELNEILIYDSDGQLVDNFGPSLTGNPVPLKSPSDIVSFPGGRIVISDTGNNRLIVCRLVEEQ